MIDITSVIKASSLTAPEQADLSSLCADLPDKLQLSIAEMLERADFDYEKEYYLEFLKKIIPAYKEFAGSSDSAIRSVLQESVGNVRYDGGRYALPFARGLVETAQRNKSSISPELQAVILQLQVSVFRDLADNEIRQALSQHILYFLDKVDMVHQLKRRFVLDAGEDIDDWGRDYLQAMESNEEVMGEQSITVDGKQLPPFVKNWLNDYLTSVPASPMGRGALEEAQYFSKSPNASKLTIEDKRILQELFQLYDWLFNPSGTFAELEAYESSASKEPEPETRSAPQAPVSDIQKLKATAQPSKKMPQFMQAPPVQPLVIPRNIQDILLDRKRPPEQVRQPQQAVPRPVPPQTQPAPSNNPTPAIDVEAKLAALRNKIQKKN